MDSDLDSDLAVGGLVPSLASPAYSVPLVFMQMLTLCSQCFPVNFYTRSSDKLWTPDRLMEVLEIKPLILCTLSRANISCCIILCSTEGSREARVLNQGPPMFVVWICEWCLVEFVLIVHQE